ncbi:MAG: carbohydrate ABC transporter permease [Bacillota bacterium]
MTPRTWRKVHRVGLAILTIAVVLVTIAPIIWMLISSVQTNTGLLAGRINLAEPRWSNYTELWKNVRFGLFLRNSLIICGFTTLFAGLFATLAGYAMARYRFKGSDTYGMAIIGTQMIPGIMFLLPLYFIFLWIKTTFNIPMVNTYYGMIIIYTAFFTPMSIWIMRGFFATIPKELEESALIDGCTPFMAFRKVILPLSAPGLIATGVYIFLTAWDELLFAWVMTTTADVATIPIGIRLYVGQFQNRYDLLMAAATVTTLPVLVTFFATQKWFISGMTAGSVKG